MTRELRYPDLCHEHAEQTLEFQAPLHGACYRGRELVMAMEEEFEVEIPDDEAENIKTVGDAINYINSHKKA